MKLVALFLTFSTLVYGQIHQTENWAPIQQAIQEASVGTVVVFDVDEVLLIPQDQILQSFHREAFDEHTHHLHHQWGKERLLEFFGILFSQREAQLVDEAVYEILEEIEAKGLYALALTQCGTGQVGQIERLEGWRLSELKGFGIHFDRLSQSEREHFFPEMTGKYGTALLKEGVIFTCSFDKGEVLMKALEVLDCSPLNLIFIDDRLHNLESVEAACEKQGIPFIGFHYQGAAHLYRFPLNFERVAFQFQYLEDQLCWLSDEEAEALKKVPNAECELIE